MIFTKDDILFYIDTVRWEFRNSSIKASAVCDIIYAVIEDSEDVLYQQGYKQAKEDMIKLLKGDTISREDVKRQIQEWINELNEAVDMLDSIPSAEHDKGQWIEDGYQGKPCVCSVCGTPQDIKAKFMFSY